MTRDAAIARFREATKNVKTSTTIALWVSFGIAAGLLIAAAAAWLTTRLAPAIETSPRARTAASISLLLSVAALWLAFALLPPPPDNPQYAKSLFRSLSALHTLLPSALLERRFIKHDPATLPPLLRVPALLLGLWGLLFTVYRLAPFLRPSLGSALSGQLAAAANPLWIALLFPFFLLPLRRR